jgi:C-terminal processing protease CtpA/Prc
MKRTVILFIAAAALMAAQAAFAQTGKTVTKKEKEQVINSLIKKMHDTYVFPDVAKTTEQQLRALQKKGTYANITDPKEFAKTLKGQLREIGNDKHLTVWYDEKRASSSAIRDTVAEKQREQEFFRFMRRVNLGFPKIDILPGNVGYFKIDGFGPVDKVGETCSGAMAFLANTDALIIDLRDNHGGDPAMVQYLVSYFFDDKPVHINSLYYRAGNQTTEYWTIPVKGEKYLNRPVYVLTSDKTFSAGEEFTYDMQTQKKATIVGETTGGGANPGDEVALGNGYFAFIPTGRAINPITKTNWEGTGVKPDVATPVADALLEAHIMAIKAIIAKMPEQEKPFYVQALEQMQQKK